MMPHTLLPECDPILLAQYAVDHRLECLQWLSRLRVGGVELALHRFGGDGPSHLGHLTDINEAVGTLEVSLDEAGETGAAPNAFRQGRITAVAVLDAVKIQFNATGLGLHQARGADGPKTVLQLSWPDSLYRLQRRNAFRIAPPRFAPAVLWLDTPDEPAQERRVDVADISATGMAFRWPLLAGNAPAPGSRLKHCRLELAGTIPIRCELLVTDIRIADPAADSLDARTRVGCQFSAIDPASARAVQMYVDAAQRRLKATRPLTVPSDPREPATDPAQVLPAHQTRSSDPRSDGHRSARST
jgi:c-di-GMP-binding flagellar brake protein YcgR